MMTDETGKRFATPEDPEIRHRATMICLSILKAEFRRRNIRVIADLHALDGVVLNRRDRELIRQAVDSVMEWDDGEPLIVLRLDPERSVH